jgi:DNA polymerase-1
MTKIYLLDAVNYLFRSYYAIGPMTNEKGESTHALYGFIRSLQKLLKDFSPSLITVVFDGPQNSKSRQALYSEYKSHRKKAPDDLYQQIDQAREYCHLAGFPMLSIEGVEADDTIASITKWAEKQDFEVFICTGDKDLYQLVNDQVFVINTHKENLLIDTKKVNELFEVSPSQILDYLSITGDASDNIPGIEGFGPKTATTLLQEYKTLENLYANIEKLPQKKQQTLLEQKENAFLSKKLASLNYAVEIPQILEFYSLKSPKKQELNRFFTDMHFLSFLEEEKPKEDQLLLFSEEPLSTSYTLVNDPDSFKLLQKMLLSSREICVDTETTDIRPMYAELVGVGFAIEPHKAWYLPVNGNIPFQEIFSFLKTLLEDSQKKFYGHNIKYDWHIFSHLGIEIKNISFDTLLASYLLNPQSRKHNLDLLTLEFFQKKKIPIEDLLDDKNKTMKDVPVERVSEYCCEDVDYTCQLKALFEKKLQKQDLTKVLEKVELPLIAVLAKMEEKGIFIDEKHFALLSSDFSSQLHILEKAIFSSIGKEFNLNSPKQLSEVLYQDLQLPQPRKKASEFSTAAPVLEKLAKDSPVVEKILEYRGLQKLLSTYVDALPKLIHPKTKRIHATFNQSGASTGRLSCQDPNLQNIPIRSSDGQKIRKGFVPQKPNWSYLSFDYSQIELRLLAHFSEDPELLKAFQNHEDIHAYTASLVFGIPQTEVSKEMRSMAKAVNFGILYGQGSFGLSEQLNISTKEASDFIQKYFARYPKVSAYLDFCKTQAEKTGYAVTLTGRKRPILEIHNKNPQIKAAAERLAINTPLQGTAADLIKLAMIEIEKTLLQKNMQGFMILQIHDELIFEIPDEEIAFFKALVKEKMEGIFSLKVPLTVDVTVGKNWGEC